MSVRKIKVGDYFLIKTGSIGRVMEKVERLAPYTRKKIECWKIRFISPKGYTYQDYRKIDYKAKIISVENILGVLINVRIL